VRGIRGDDSEGLKIEGYEIKPHDYKKKVEQDGAQVGLCEIEGKRPDQEDAFSFSTKEVAFLPLLPDESIKRVFNKTFADIQEKHGNIDTIGTTGLATSAWVDPQTHTLTAWVANLGDSTAHLVILDANGQLKEAILMNEVHDPGSETELERFDTFKWHPGMPDETTIGDLLRKDLSDGKEPRLPGGGLKLARGFGDTNVEPYGFSHKVQLHKIQRVLQPGEQAFIITSCDGLTENDILDADKIGQIVRDHKDKSPEEIAEALVNEAYKKGSGDNISVGVSLVGSKPVSIAVFDGHGGEYVGENNEHQGKTAAALSKEISKAFYVTLRQNLEQVMDQVKAIKDDYEQLRSIKAKIGIATHKKDIDNLLKQVDTIFFDPNMEPSNKPQKIIDVLEAALSDQVFKGGGKNAKANVAKINNETDDHHYTRLLAITYQTFINDPYFQQAKINANLKSYVNQIALPETPFYASKLSGLLTEKQKTGLEASKKILSDQGIQLTDIQLYRLMNGHDSLDNPIIIRQLFPNLTSMIPTLGGDPLIALRDGGEGKAREALNRTQELSDQMELGIHQLTKEDEDKLFVELPQKLAAIRTTLDSLKSPLEIKSEREVTRLRSSVFLALDHYTYTLKRRAHSKDMSNLYEKVAAISMDLSKPANERYELMINELIMAYQKELKPAFLSRAFVFNSKVNSNKFAVEILNKKNKSYHYPREIGTILQMVMNSNDRVPEPEWLAKIRNLNVDKIKHDDYPRFLTSDNIIEPKERH
jgi:serine/threonine protein phosphatase PrpC